MSNLANEIFTLAYSKCERELPFDIKWSNGSGYFDYAVYGENAPKLNNGEMVKSISPGGRRILIVGTRLGNVAVFDMFKDQGPGQKDAHRAVFARNCNSAVEMIGWFADKSLNGYEMGLITGDVFDETRDGNIGWRIEQFRSAINAAAKKIG